MSFPLSSRRRKSAEKQTGSIVRLVGIQSWAFLSNLLSLIFTDRFSIISLEFAAKLHAILTPHLPSFPYPTSARRVTTNNTPRTPHSFNSNIRVYKYTPLQHFGAHYDDSVRDAMTGAKSEWTLLIYLTGVEDGVEGGEVSCNL
jgi:hypothetical protein